MDDNVKDYKTGNEEATSNLYYKCYKQVYYSIYRMIGNQEEAKDILQYGFMKSFEHIDEIVDDDHFVKYLYTVVNNKCIDYLKKKKSINFSEIVEESEDNFEIEDLNEDFIRDKVANVQALRDYISEELNKLPNDQKMCIMLYFYEQLSISEISSMLQCSESTIKSKLKYGKQKLADSIGRYQKENDIKLYNISVVPLMMWMFNAECELVIIPKFQIFGSTVETGKVISEAVNKGKGAGSSALKKKATKNIVKHAIGKNAVIGALVTSTAVVGGGIVAADYIKEQRANESMNEMEKQNLYLKEEVKIIEYGEIYNISLEDFLLEPTEEIIQNSVITLDIPKEEGKEYPAVNKYSGTITYKEETVNITVEVNDTTAPAFKDFKEKIEIEKGTKKVKYEDYFTIEDLSESKITVDDKELNMNQVGTYSINVIGEDIYGNKVEKESKVEVVEKEVAVVEKPKEQPKEPQRPTEPKRKRIPKPDFPPEKIVEDYWWEGLSHEEIKNEVIGSLVWWNEWTGEIYYGFDGLKFGCNVEDWYYAGLCLEQNPYNVQMDFSFYGGPNSNINVNSFVAWWVTPISKDGFQVDLGTFTVEVPPPITLDEFDAYYYE